MWERKIAERGIKIGDLFSFFFNSICMGWCFCQAETPFKNPRSTTVSSRIFWCFLSLQDKIPRNNSGQIGSPRGPSGRVAPALAILVFTKSLTFYVVSGTTFSSLGPFPPILTSGYANAVIESCVVVCLIVVGLKPLCYFSWEVWAYVILCIAVPAFVGSCNSVRILVSH